MPGILTLVSQRLLEPLRAWNAPRERCAAQDDFVPAALRPLAPQPHALDAAPAARRWRDALLGAAQGDEQAPLRLEPRIRRACVIELDALLNALACVSPHQARQLAGLHPCWKVLLPRCTTEQALRFSHWLRHASPADHNIWALQQLHPLLHSLGQTTKMRPAERAETMRLLCLTLRLGVTDGFVLCRNADFAGVATVFFSRGQFGTPLTLYNALCAQLRVPKADRERLAPWVARLGEGPLPSLSQPPLGKAPLPGALAWEILELVICHVSRFADTPSPTHELPPCLRALLAGDLAHAEPRPQVTLPSGLPQLVLRHLSAGLAAGSPLPPACLRAWLAMLRPHAVGLADDVLLRCASAAQRLGADPWPWLFCKTQVHHSIGHDRDDMRAWIAFIAAAPPPPEPLPPNLRAALSHALERAEGSDLNLLLGWVIDHPQLHLDLQSFFKRPRTGLNADDPRTVRQVHILYGRAPRSIQLYAMENGTFRELLPALAQTLVAQRWLASGRYILGTDSTRPLRALRHVLENTRPSRDFFAEFPEFVLIETPEFLASPGLPAGLNAPPWALPMLLRQAPCADAAHAQQNRLRALGRLLLACRISHASPARMAALAPLIERALDLPNVRARRALLDLLVARVITDPDNDAAYAEALRLQAHTAAKAQMLQLAALCRTPGWHNDPGTQTLLQARALFNHGEHARCVLELLLDRTGDGSLRATALRWANAAKLARVIDSHAQQQRDRDALRAARTALRACVQMQRGSQSERAAAAQRQRQALEALRQAQDISAVHAGARAQMRSRFAAPLPQQRNATAPLDEALAWLQQQPTLREALAPVSALSQNNPCANDARWAQARSALKAARNQAPKAEAWLHRYAEGVVLALQSHAPGPSNTAHDAADASLRTPRPTSSPEPSPAPLDAAFFAHPKIRAFMVERVLPLALELGRYAPLAQAAGVDMASLTDPAEVLPACLEWTRLSATELQRLDAVCPDLAYVAIYAGSLRKRNGPTQWQDEATLRTLLRASAAGELDSLRRNGPQAQCILKLPDGRATMAGWEHSQRLEATAGGPGWTTEDTGEPGLMLRAVTDIRSCQSARDGDQNRGMLGRLTDGARRMLLLRDPRGAVRGRAVVRLMTEDEQPVLLLSTSYVGAGMDDDRVKRALRAHVTQRAQALGIRAAAPSENVWYLATDDSVAMLDLMCAGGALDYWDEAGGLRKDPVNLFTDMALLTAP